MDLASAFNASTSLVPGGGSPPSGGGTGGAGGTGQAGGGPSGTPAAPSGGRPASGSDLLPAALQDELALCLASGLALDFGIIFRAAFHLTFGFVLASAGLRAESSIVAISKSVMSRVGTPGDDGNLFF